MFNFDTSCCENSVDSDQLASEKPADHDLHCFSVTLWIYAFNWNPAS